MDKRKILLNINSQSTDIRLHWKVPREDHYTLNPFSQKNQEAHNQLKINKIAFYARLCL